MGAGRTEIVEMIFGVRPYAGEIRVDGQPVHMRDPSSAMRHGIGFVTEDRKLQGLVLGMTVRENFSLTHLEDYCTLQFVSRARESENCRTFVRSLDIRTPSIEQQAVNLSGGNQQKVVIARWLANGFRTLLCFDAMRGIDIGTKHQIYRLVRDLAAAGSAVLLFTSELPEIHLACDRAIVLFGGRIVDEMPAADADEETLLRAAHGLTAHVEARA
jgi:ribose transport system ATP-binding protein